MSHGFEVMWTRLDEHKMNLTLTRFCDDLLKMGLETGWSIQYSTKYAIFFFDFIFETKSVFDDGIEGKAYSYTSYAIEKYVVVISKFYTDKYFNVYYILLLNMRPVKKSEKKGTNEE